MTAATVVILAAGRGSRLGALTDDRPKCLIDLGGTTPLDLCLDVLAAAPEVAEVRIVVGHAAEWITARLAERRDAVAVRCVPNPRWDTANNLVSTLLVADLAGQPFLIVNSDVVCDPRILRRALAADGDFLVVDPARPPRDEAMKVRETEGRLEAIAKTLDPATAAGEYIGIARFSPHGGRAFFAAATDLAGAGGDQEWYEAAIAVAAGRAPIRLQSIGDLAWIEIDDPADLERARREVLPAIARLLRSAKG